MLIFMQNLNEVVGANVAACRKQAGMSQAALAAQFARFLDRDNVDPTTITRLESGKRPTTIEELEALSQVFGVEYSDLLRRGDNLALSVKLRDTVESAWRSLGEFREQMLEIGELLQQQPDSVEFLSNRELFQLEQVWSAWSDVPMDQWLASK